MLCREGNIEDVRGKRDHLCDLLNLPRPKVCYCTVALSMSSFTYLSLQSAPGTAMKQHPHPRDEMASYRGTARNMFICASV